MRGSRIGRSTKNGLVLYVRLFYDNCKNVIVIIDDYKLKNGEQIAYASTRACTSGSYNRKTRFPQGTNQFERTLATLQSKMRQSVAAGDRWWFH